MVRYYIPTKFTNDISLHRTKKITKLVKFCYDDPFHKKRWIL